jgi:anti-anti-sigma regulatory factor
MPQDAAYFDVRENGERTVVAFRDWGSLRKRLSYLEETCVADITREIQRICEDNHCKLLAIDLADVNVMPSSLLAVLVSLSANGLQVELVRPSKSLVELLEIAKLNHVFAVRG